CARDVFGFGLDYW
nr:immunoglobulin heavy chain junction region [Macaca mulatta]MOX96169.1 immunoglobulin heavy chain junction region [Macaca mulatta]